MALTSAEKQRRYRERHPGRAAESTRRFREKNPDKVRATRVKQWAKHGDKYRARMRERAKERYAEDPDRILARNREQYLKNRELYLETGRERYRRWAKENREKCRASYHRYRARRIQAPGEFTGDDVSRMMLAQKERCLYCARLVSENYHVDHRTPLSRGGTNFPENLCIACPRCNYSKGSLTESEFFEKIREEGLPSAHHL